MGLVLCGVRLGENAEVYRRLVSQIFKAPLSDLIEIKFAYIVRLCGI